VTDIFPARETPPPGFDARQVAAGLNHAHVYFTPTLGEAVAVLLDEVQPPAVVVVLSAGDAPEITRRALEGWRAK